MNRYEQDRYRDDYGRNYENRNNRRNQDSEHKLSNYLSRYQGRGNYYGMPDNEYEYRNGRSSRGANFGNSSSGPVGGYGASNYHDNYNRDQGNSGRSSGQLNNYNTGNSQGNRGSNQSDHYRYGDPNPYMDYNRNGGYERTRGTGWRSESDDSRRGSSDYSRQDNSYRYGSGGSGKRYENFGRDERYNYGHGERMTDIHTDRGPHRERRSDNNYGNQQSRNRDDNYASGMYSSNRAYLAEQGQDRDRNMFDHTDDDYPSRSPRGYGYRSGPDWSADSPINRGHHTGATRG